MNEKDNVDELDKTRCDSQALNLRFEHSFTALSFFPLICFACLYSVGQGSPRQLSLLGPIAIAILLVTLKRDRGRLSGPMSLCAMSMILVASYLYLALPADANAILRISLSVAGVLPTIWLFYLFVKINASGSE